MPATSGHNHLVNPMDLKQIKGIGPAKMEKLKLAGVTSVEDLARCDPAFVSGRSGLPETQVRELKQRAAAYAVLEDMKGVGWASFATLSEAGAKSVRELLAASNAWVKAQVKVAQARVEDARTDAEAFTKHVVEGARTPEGRRQLLVDAREGAQKAAREAEVAGRKAVAATQRATEATLARARELREQAPEMRARAEAALKDAELRLKEATQKAESVLRAEGEKAKARGQRVVDQTKARLNQAK